VAAAVRAAGYLSEETDGVGSSGSGEDELEYADAESGPPSYTHDMEVGRKTRDPSTDAGGTVERRPSKRQQEKAAEAHLPHAGEAHPPPLHDVKGHPHHAGEAQPPAPHNPHDAQLEEEKMMPGGSRFIENT
jgi:hypothetical protein